MKIESNNMNNSEYEAVSHEDIDYVGLDFDGEYTSEQIYKRDLLENLWYAMEGIVFALAADDLPEGTRDSFVRAYQFLGYARDAILKKIASGNRIIYFAGYNREVLQKP